MVLVECEITRKAQIVYDVEDITEEEIKKGIFKNQIIQMKVLDNNDLNTNSNFGGKLTILEIDKITRIKK